MLHFERLSMLQQDGRVPDILIRANLPSISKHNDETSSIVDNNERKHAVKYFQQIADGASVSVMSHAATGLIKTIIVSLLDYDNLRPGDNVPCSVRITEGSHIIAEGPSQVTIPIIPSPKPARKAEGHRSIAYFRHPSHNHIGGNGGTVTTRSEGDVHKIALEINV